MSVKLTNRFDKFLKKGHKVSAPVVAVFKQMLVHAHDDQTA